MKPRNKSHYCHFTASFADAVLSGLGDGLPSTVSEFAIT